MLNTITFRLMLIGGLFTSLTVTSFKALAQAKAIKGYVYTALHEPVIGATVAGYSTATQKQYATTHTDIKGAFNIKVNADSIYLYVTHVGYMPQKATSLYKDSVVIYLTPQSRQLTEVVVKSQKPFIEQQFDRLVVNVDGNSKAGMNAVDILKKVPGIGVANGNALTLEGKALTVYLDGKLLRLSGDELLALLNNTSSAGISQIDVMHNPSARFDAQGDGGIINIKTLKRSKPGYDGYLSFGGGHGWKYFAYNTASAGINYRLGKSYLYGSYGFGFGTQSQEIYTYTTLTAIRQRLVDSLAYRSPYRDHNLRLGWDYHFNKKNIIGFLLTSYQSKRQPARATETGIYQLESSVKDSTRFSSNINPRTSKGINLNVNYKKVIDSVRKQELSIDADAGIFVYNNTNLVNLLLQNAVQQPLTPVQQLSQAGQTTTHIVSNKADYTQALHKGMLEAGIKTSYVNVNNNFVSLSGLKDDGPLNNYSGNNFIYKESILAGYLSSKQTFGNLTLQAGLRAEQTFTTGNSVTIDSMVKRQYLNLFPNVTAGYRLKNHFVSASYARRIGRPVYSYLNPFFIVESAYSAFQGNPFLQPSHTNNYRLNYTYKGQLSFTLSYSQSHNIISDLAVVNNETKVTARLKANLSNSKSNSFYTTYYHKLFKILDINYSLGLQYNRYRFNYNDAPVSIKQLTGTAYFDNQLSLPKNWWIEVYTYASTRITYGNQITLPLTTTAVSGGKKILHGKGSLSLNINDIFFTGVQRSVVQYGNVNYTNKSQYDSRNIRLNVTYNFGNSRIEVRKRTSGSSDEQGRTQ